MTDEVAVNVTLDERGELIEDVPLWPTLRDAFRAHPLGLVRVLLERIVRR